MGGKAYRHACEGEEDGAASTKHLAVYNVCQTTKAAAKVEDAHHDPYSVGSRTIQHAHEAGHCQHATHEALIVACILCKQRCFPQKVHRQCCSLTQEYKGDLTGKTDRPP